MKEVTRQSVLLRWVVQPIPVSANAPTSILGVTQHCIQGEAALKAPKDCAPALLRLAGWRQL